MANKLLEDGKEKLKSVDWTGKTENLRSKANHIADKITVIWNGGHAGKAILISSAIAVVVVLKLVLGTTNSPECAIEKWLNAYAAGKSSAIMKAVANVDGRYDDEFKEWRVNAKETCENLRYLKKGLDRVKWSVEGSKISDAPEYLEKKGVDKTARVEVVFKRKSDGKTHETKFTAVRYKGEWLARDLELDLGLGE